jgi:hypothetical protein
MSGITDSTGFITQSQSASVDALSSRDITVAHQHRPPASCQRINRES